MSEWKEYTGIDEQIAEIKDSKFGFILRLHDGFETAIHPGYEITECLVHEHASTTHYWLIPDDPLREMKIRQAQTGQPVWMKYDRSNVAFCTITPNWNIPGAEYSFEPFEIGDSK